MKDSTKRNTLRDFLNFCDDLGRISLISLTNDMLIEKFIDYDRKWINAKRSTPATNKDTRKEQSAAKRLKIALVAKTIVSIRAWCYEKEVPFPTQPEFQEKYHIVLKESDVRGLIFEDVIVVDALKEINKELLISVQARLAEKYTHNVYKMVDEDSDGSEPTQYFVDTKANEQVNAKDVTLMLVAECIAVSVPEDTNITFSPNDAIKVQDVVYDSFGNIVKIIKVKYF